jgi:hypothetical protein
MAKHRGACHCGKVAYEVEADMKQVVSCNCSICAKRGFLWTFVPPPQFTLKSGGDAGLVSYKFHKHVVDHLFCPTCGVEAFARGTTPDGKEVVAVNVRCLEGVEVGSLTPTQFDGRSLR